MALFRIQPLMPPQAYVTYSMASPRDTSIVQACKDAGCLAWAHGWDTTVDEATPLGRDQAAFIRRQSGRTFTERSAAGLTVFRFEAFQRCFAEHRTRPQRYLVTGGDWRGNPRGETRVHARAGDWVEDMALRMDGLAAAIGRG